MIGSLGIKSGEPIIYRKKRVENMKKAKIIFLSLIHIFLVQRLWRILCGMLQQKLPELCLAFLPGRILCEVVPVSYPHLWKHFCGKVAHYE